MKTTVYVKEKISIYYYDIDYVSNLVQEILANQPTTIHKHYFEQCKEWDYNDEYYQTYYIVVRDETDEEYAERIALEEKRKKFIEDRELEQLAILQAKYGEK
jgi:uncharacterized protein involved in type VI secretion and phage assembly